MLVRVDAADTPSVGPNFGPWWAARTHSSAGHVSTGGTAQIPMPLANSESERRRNAQNVV